MNLLHKFSSLFDRVAHKLISSHLISLLHILFITSWLLLKLDLSVLVLILSLEGVTIWTVVLKSTNRIQDIQEKKDRFENKRFREFLESDIEATQQSLKISKEIFRKLQELESKLEELESKVESEPKTLEIANQKELSDVPPTA